MSARQPGPYLLVPVTLACQAAIQALIYKPASRPQPRLFHFIKVPRVLQALGSDSDQCGISDKLLPSMCPLDALVPIHREGRSSCSNNRTELINPEPTRSPLKAQLKEGKQGSWSQGKPSQAGRQRSRIVSAYSHLSFQTQSWKTSCQ